jgi:hypothetical protein
MTAAVTVIEAVFSRHSCRAYIERSVAIDLELPAIIPHPFGALACESSQGL